MGLLADWQIQKDIKIEPFADGSRRPGTISYGLTSYGYDVRVGRHFKVFTNVYGAVVDPKNFSPAAFIDIEADSCVIPPNSFALAETVEYFEIPRDILCLCLGKSTYARCFRGNTRVALVDGTAPTLEEMAPRAEAGELFWGYSIGPHGRLMVTLLEKPRFIGRDSLVEVMLDNDQSVFCTPDHGFLTRDGRMVQAHTLRPGDALMPLYRWLARGYEMVYMPLNGHLYPTHRLADEWNLRNGIYADVQKTHRHHVDHNRRNKALAFWREEEYAAIRDRVLHQRQNPSEETRQAHREATLRRYSDPAERERHSLAMVNAWAKDDARRQRQAEVMRAIKIRSEITAEVARAALDQMGSIRGAARLLDCDRSVFRRFPEVVAAFHGRGEKNHKVVAVREVAGTHDVYCLTVPEAGNFALEAGVFVHNCGIIVNVTPLEPEWRGKITIEISNTTPLPAKIYANEGIAQILFFRAEQVCKTSYADKKGKYQDQKGLTLPFVVGDNPPA